MNGSEVSDSDTDQGEVECVDVVPVRERDPPRGTEPIPVSAQSEWPGWRNSFYKN